MQTTSLFRSSIISMLRRRLDGSHPSRSSAQQPSKCSLCSGLRIVSTRSPPPRAPPRSPPLLVLHLLTLQKVLGPSLRCFVREDPDTEARPHPHIRGVRPGSGQGLHHKHYLNLTNPSPRLIQSVSGADASSLLERYRHVTSRSDSAQITSMYFDKYDLGQRVGWE